MARPGLGPGLGPAGTGWDPSSDQIDGSRRENLAKWRFLAVERVGPNAERNKWLPQEPQTGYDRGPAVAGGTVVIKLFPSRGNTLPHASHLPPPVT